MIVFRLSKLAWASDLSGNGARLAGGRWNSQGTAMVYTSESRALCTVEIAVRSGLGLLPSGYQLITIEIPDDASILEIRPDQLRPEWRTFPYPVFTRHFGNRFVKDNKALILKVPSAVVPGDFNYLINPAHKDISQIKIVSIEAFEFDERMR